jgi:quercetin dioxygenase-like cupin family protein
MHGYFIEKQDCNPRNPFPGITINAFSGERMTVALVDLAPGAIVPEHDHPHEQLGLLVEGELRFTIDGQTRTLQAGACWRIPGGVRHEVVAGPQGAKALDVFAPTRPEYVG